MPGGVYGHQNGAALGDGHPRFLARGERSRVWDVDGNEYVDWMCAYGPMILGYRPPGGRGGGGRAARGRRLPPAAGPAHGGAGRAAGGPHAARRLRGLRQERRGRDELGGGRGARAHRPAAHRARAGRLSRRAAVGAARTSPASPRTTATTCSSSRGTTSTSWRALFAAHPGEIAVVMTAPFDHVTGAAPAPGFFAGLRALCDAARRRLRDGRRARGLPLQPRRLLRALRGRARPHLLLQGHRQRPRRSRPGSPARRCGRRPSASTSPARSSSRAAPFAAALATLDVLARDRRDRPHPAYRRAPVRRPRRSGARATASR